MAEQKQDDQLEHTYSSYVRIWGVTRKTCRRRCTIERSGERGSRISVLAAQHDDDDDANRHHPLDIYYPYLISDKFAWIRIRGEDPQKYVVTYILKLDR